MKFLKILNFKKMGLLRKTKEQPKQEKTISEKHKKVKIEKTEQPTVKVETPDLPKVELPKPEAPKTEATEVVDKGKYWEGIGLIGNNDIVNTFRATARFRKEKIGQLLCDYMKEYNQKNKF